MEELILLGFGILATKSAASAQSSLRTRFTGEPFTFTTLIQHTACLKTDFLSVHSTYLPGRTSKLHFPSPLAVVSSVSRVHRRAYTERLRESIAGWYSFAR